MKWLNFIGFQFLAGLVMVLGWFILVPLCAFKVWTYDLARDKYHFPRLFYIWDNDEDGVCPHWYNPQATRWRAYLWTAWRNSANNLRWKFADKTGPFFRWENKAKTWYFQAGYGKNTGWPVLSAGKIYGP